MRRSDGVIAIGLGTCISRDGFNPDSETQVGDKCLIFTYAPEFFTERGVKRSIQAAKDKAQSVSGVEACTWGELGQHYRLDYEFPLEHIRRPDIICKRKEIDYER